MLNQHNVKFAHTGSWTRVRLAVFTFSLHQLLALASHGVDSDETGIKPVSVTRPERCVFHQTLSRSSHISTDKLYAPISPSPTGFTFISWLCLDVLDMIWGSNQDGRPQKWQIWWLCKYAESLNRDIISSNTTCFDPVGLLYPPLWFVKFVNFKLKFLGCTLQCAFWIYFAACGWCHVCCQRTLTFH